MGRLPDGLLAVAPEPPPSQWTNSQWQLLAQFEAGGDLEFMAVLPRCRNKDEAMALAEQHISFFIREKRKQYH